MLGYNGAQIHAYRVKQKAFFNESLKMPIKTISGGNQARLTRRTDRQVLKESCDGEKSPHRKSEDREKAAALTATLSRNRSIWKLCAQPKLMLAPSTMKPVSKSFDT